MQKALFIEWNDNDNIGIPIVDEQHRGIVSTINSFYHFIRQGHGVEAVQPTLNILWQYTRIHFSTEEALLKEAKYPLLESHLLLHKDLVKKVADAAEEFRVTEDPEPTLTLLKEWWLNHIRVEDARYAAELRRKG